MSRRNVVAAHTAFAETEPLLLRGPRAHQRLGWMRCGCTDSQLVRIPRSSWMRVLPMLRLYTCISCGRRVMLARSEPSVGYGAVYLPARPLRGEPGTIVGLLAKLPPTMLGRRKGAPRG